MCSEGAKEGMTFHCLRSGYHVLPLLVEQYGVDMPAPPQPVPWMHCESSENDLDAAGSE